MRSYELPFVLLALVLCQAPWGAAAPVSAGGDTVLAKMYPRGNHWAVGHLMGKKSTGELPYTAEGNNLKQQLRQSIQWEEAARNLLGLIEAKGNKNHKPLGNLQPTWDSKESNNFEDTGSKHKESLSSAEQKPQKINHSNSRPGRNPRFSSQVAHTITIQSQVLDVLLCDSNTSSKWYNETLQKEARQELVEILHQVLTGEEGRRP